MTKCFHITVEYAVVWMQTWKMCCQDSGMLRKMILCHVCKHVTFLEASNAQYLRRAVAKLPAINLMSLSQISYIVCIPKAEFISYMPTTDEFPANETAVCGGQLLPFLPGKFSTEIQQSCHQGATQNWCRQEA